MRRRRGEAVVLVFSQQGWGEWGGELCSAGRAGVGGVCCQRGEVVVFSLQGWGE